MDAPAFQNTFSLTTPLLFVVFNRPDTTRRVFEAIREARPPQLFVAADGARPERAEEIELVEQVRQIATAVDWPCELKVRFSEKNQGCRVAVSSAINWFFSEVSEGIILEDDCRPSPDFFRYAAAALQFYRDDSRVMHINGSTFVKPENLHGYCGFFYRYAHVWGWASWRRAWQYYDVELENFDPHRTFELFPDDPKQAARWNEILTKVREHRPGFDTWDFQWTFAILAQHAWCLTPAGNLISNIGRDQSTHDMEAVSRMLDLSIENLPGELRFPTERFSDTAPLEKQVYQSVWAPRTIWRRIGSNWKSAIRKIMESYVLSSLRFKK